MRVTSARLAALLERAPPTLVQLMRGLPQWIAVSDGVDTTWVHALDATPEQWRAYADMKEELT